MSRTTLFKFGFSWLILFAGIGLLCAHEHTFLSDNFCNNALANNVLEKYVLLINNQHKEFKLWQRELNKAGINARHWFPPDAGIVVLSIDENFIWNGNLPAQFYAVLTNEELSRFENISDAMRAAVHAFIKLQGLQDHPQSINIFPSMPQLQHDVFIPPIPQPPVMGACSAAYLKRSNSEYLLKSVSVNVILPESTGAIDASTENWSAARENSVVSEITAGLNFLSSAYTGPAVLRPTFTYHWYFGRTNALAHTSYEPINRSADPVSEPGTGEGLWTNQIYNQLGYSSFSDRWQKGQEFDGNTRVADGTDWAYTIFVVDSYNDSDGLFADGYFAYAWLGGPHLIQTYDNDGWGISGMDMVTRHESSHIFYTLDEYASSGCTCTEASGYINYQNQNCENSCTYNGNCIMSSASKQQAGVVCNFTRGMLGWGDSDTDSAPDPVDISPETSIIAYSPDPTPSTTLTFQGTAIIQTRTNQNIYNYHCDINVLHIAGVDYRVDSGAWNPASACDGTFDSGNECYTFTVTLATGTHLIETRSRDELGQLDATPASDSVTISPSALALQSLKPIIDDTGSPTHNGIIEPNESIALLGRLLNLGSSTTATSVTGTLSSTSPITITDNSATYPDIAPAATQTCTTCYAMVAPSANRPATHWDFMVKETPSCSGCPASQYSFLYHVGNSFSDVAPASVFYSYIEAILHSGVTSGCTISAYCPLSNVQRGQMAKFICASMHASNSATCITSACASLFNDVPPANLFCPYIEALYTAGIVAGCQTSPLAYCPNNDTDRQGMAKFVCLGMQGANPGSCTTAVCTGVFSDVTSSNPFCSYIEALYNASVISGCTSSTYCPNSKVTREQMSKFLVNGFGFTL